MPEAPTAAPAAPPSAPAAPAAPDAPAISVTPAAVDKGPAQPPPKPGSARDRMFSELRKRSGDTSEPSQPSTTPPDDSGGEPDAGGEAPPAGTTPPPAAADKGKKVSPWKMVDQYKARVTELEKQIADAKTASLAEKEKTEFTTKITELQKKLEEHESNLRFTDYQKSEEFKSKYQKPYEEAWVRAMNELGELTVTDPTTGNERNVSAEDMMELVRLPLAQARSRAQEVYGDFAEDAMVHRKEIRNLFSQQQQALEDAKKNGAEWEKQRNEKAAAERTATTTQIRDMWSKFNEAATKDEKVGHFFRPVDGDEEGNKRLAKGYELADKAFSANPLDPRLTPEQRAEVVKVHAAVRNRAAAFGRTMYQLQKANEMIESLKKQLGQFKSTVPGAGEGGREKTDAPASARDSVFGALRKIAH